MKSKKGLSIIGIVTGLTFVLAFAPAAFADNDRHRSRDHHRHSRSREVRHVQHIRHVESHHSRHFYKPQYVHYRSSRHVSYHDRPTYYSYDHHTYGHYFYSGPVISFGFSYGPSYHH